MALSNDDPTICAVIVTFNPDGGFAARLEAVRRQVSLVVIVDNGSAQPIEAPDPPLPGAHLEIIHFRRNQGIAAGLNVGIRRAAALGYAWVLTLDQDSEVEEEMIGAMQRAYEGSPRNSEVAVIAPRVIQRGIPRPPRYLRPFLRVFYHRSLCHGETLDPVTAVITSGSLLRTEAFSAIGGMKEDFFVDFVDTEFCLRLQQNGYRIIVACPALLWHKLGNRREARLGLFRFYPTFHSPERWYYISRNRIPMMRMYAWRFPHWFTYEVVASTYVLLRMLLFEDRRREKLKAIVRGTVDGLLGRLGPGPLGAS